MRLSYDHLELNNYRYYYGTQEMVFSTTSEKNVVVIKGDNGAGKSNILNALTWCLYGSEVHVDPKDADLPIMNTQYIAELAEKGLEGVCSVKLTITVDGEMWEVERSLNGFGDKDHDWTEEEPKYTFTEMNRVFRVTYPVGNGHKTVLNEEAQNKIAEHLPKDLRSFFFIDGEQLHEFFKKDAKRNLQSSIEKLSQLEIVDSAIESMKIFRKDLSGKIKKTHPNLSRIQQQVGEVDRECERLGKIKEKTLIERSSAEDELKSIDKYLENYNVSGINHITQQLSLHRKLLKESEDERLSMEKKKHKYLLSVAPSILMKDTVKEAYSVIDTLIERGTLPPMIRESFIHELLEEGVCVCGTPLTPEARKTLTDYANKIQISEMDGIAQEGKIEFLSHLEKIRRFKEEIETYNEILNRYDDRIEDIKQNIEDKENELREHNIEEINEKSQRRSELAAKIAEANVRIRAADTKLSAKQSELRQLERAEKSELEKSQIYSEHVETSKHVKTSLEVLDRVKEKVKDRIRLSLEENTRKYFFEFLREEGLFRDVTINERYEVAVINNQGWNNLGSLSAGQYLVLGYAFVVALRAITGYQAPVIVDTPLGKLDQTHQDKITRYLPTLLDSAQLVFLVTSSEYTQTVKENFSKFMDEKSYYEIHKCPDITSARLVHGI